MVSSRFMVFGACAALTVLAQPSFAADYPETWRGSFDCCQEEPLGSSLGFEVGLRYVYSQGKHAMSAGGNSYSIEDKSHIIEGHFRIDDYSTATFLRGSAGFAAKVSGSYSVPGTLNAPFEGGDVISAGADFGWLPADWGNLRAGLFGGYNYMNESPDMGWTTTPGVRTKNALGIHTLRLGISARANFSDTFDLSADAAIIPYAWLSGTYGAYAGGAAAISGGLYGVAGEVSAGFHFVPQGIFRVGARGSYLTGEASLTRGGTTTTTNDIRFSRIGTFAELTYGF